MTGGRGWFASGFSTAAGMVAEFSAGGAGYGSQGAAGERAQVKLTGYAVTLGTSVASTVPVVLEVGISSAATLTVHPIMNQGIADSVHVSGIKGITGGYFRVSSTSAHTVGLTANIWGEL